MTLHECSAGRACRDPIIDCETRRREPALIEKPHGLCRACERAVRQAIRELDEDYIDLGNAQRTAKGELSVRLTPDPVVPINTTAQALQFELAEWAEAAMLLVSDRLNVAVAMRQKLRGYPVNNWPVIMQCQRVLVDNLHLLLDAKAKPVRVWATNGMSCDTVELDGIAVALKIQRAHSKVKGVLGESNPRKRLTMPCPIIDCAMPTLGINNGETDVTCTSCGGHWTEAEYDWLAGMLVGSTSEKEIHMLQWLLAEARWLHEQSIIREIAQAEKLSAISRLAHLDPDELKAYDAATFAALACEILDEAPVCITPEPENAKV